MFKNKRFLIIAGIIIFLLIISVLFRGGNQTQQPSSGSDTSETADDEATDETSGNTSDDETTESTDPDASDTSTGDIQARTSCDFFTAEVVRKAMNKTAVTSGPGERPVSGNGIVTSDCVYEVQGMPSMTIASTLLYSATDSTAYSANAAAFRAGKVQTLDDTNDAKSEKVRTVGDDAYYNPEMRQAGVLIDEGKYWFVVQVTSGKEDTIAVAKALAQQF